MSAVSDQLRRLSELLGLDYEEQDWGIINADGKRLEEFVTAYDTHTFSREMRYQMFELVVASANDALDEEHDDVRTKLVIQDFVRRHGEDFPEQVSYWGGLKNSEEFPVAKVLRNISSSIAGGAEMGKAGAKTLRGLCEVTTGLETCNERWQMSTWVQTIGMSTEHHCVATDSSGGRMETWGASVACRWLARFGAYSCATHKL